MRARAGVRMVLLVTGAALAVSSRVAAQDGGGSMSGLDPRLWQTSSPSWNGLSWEQLAPGVYRAPLPDRATAR